MKLKTILVLAMLVFALAFAVACNSNDEPEVTPPTENVTQDPPAQNDPPVQPEDDNDNDNDDPVDETPAARFDFGGREFVILTHNPRESTFDPDPTIEDPLAEDRWWANLQRIYEDYNAIVRFEVVAYEDLFELFINSVMADAPLGDLVEVPSGHLGAAIAQNLILPLDEFIPQGEDIWAASGSWTVPVTFLGGRYYGIGANARFMYGQGFLVYNKDVIAAAGLEDPGALYDRGEWTWDVFLDYLRTTTTMGPDGAPNQFGLGGCRSDLVRLMIASNQGMLVDPADFSFAMDNPNTIRALEFASQIFSTENLTIPFTGDWWGDMTRCAYGDVAFWTAPYWMLGWAFGDIPLGGVPFPVGPDNTGNYALLTGFTFGMAVPRGVEDPLAVYHLWNEVQQADRFFSSYALDSPTGEVPVERIHRASLEGWIQGLFDTVEDANRVDNAMNNRQLIDLGTNTPEFLSGVLLDGLVAGESPAQLVESQRPVVEDRLVELFGALR